jgi:hypothetical protein
MRQFIQHTLSSLDASSVVDQLNENSERDEVVRSLFDAIGNGSYQKV